MANMGIDHHVYIGRNSTFGICFIKVMKIDIAANLSILLLHGNNVGMTSRVLDGFGKTNIQELLDLLFDLHLNSCL